MGSSKKKSKTKQFWGLPVDVRMKTGKEWVEVYKGDNLVKDYSKTFGLNLKNSLKELVKLGASISNEDRERVKRYLREKENKREKRKQKALAKEYQEYEDYYDDTFAFIAGYTEGGSPFGITYEEMEEYEMEEVEGRTPKY